MIFDTHAHYNEPVFDEDRDALLKDLHENQGIAAIANVGYHHASIEAAHRLAEQYDFIYEVLGFHPDETREMEAEADTVLPWLRDQLARPKVIALGEIGLDYYWDKTDRDVQKKWFLAQMELAKELDLPVVIHSREAAQDTLEILKKAEIPAGYLVMHCFSYSPEVAKICLNMGYFLGIGGVSTFKNARKIREVIAQTPLERILLETDAPYLTPAPFRGRRNDSGKLPLVIQAIAAVKGLPEEEVEEACFKNACRFYRMDAERLQIR